MHGVGASTGPEGAASLPSEEQDGASLGAVFGKHFSCPGLAGEAAGGAQFVLGACGF